MYYRNSMRISYTFWYIERLNIYPFNLKKMQLNSNKLLLCISILLIPNFVLLQNEYTQRISCLVKIQSERKNKWLVDVIKNSSHWFEKLMKATFQNYDPNDCIPADKIKPNLQNKYFCSDSFVDDTNQAPPDIPWWIGALLSNIYPAIGIFFVIINGLK
jgi:hypothetical protein